MTLYMYDAAYGPTLDKLKRKAVAGSHYMTRSFAGSSFQPAALRAAGFGALHNFEGMAAELVGASRAKGQAVANEALAALTPSAPRDGSLAIAYSVDTDVTNLAACDEVFRGINDVHHGTGIKVMAYAEGGLLLRLHSLGLVQGKQWLSMSEGFGGFHQALTSGVVGIVQMHDATGKWIGTDVPGTDRNTILDPTGSGIWWPDGSPYAPKPTSHATPTIARPVTVSGSEEPMARIVIVDPKDCVRRKIKQLGAFIDHGDGNLRHLGSPEFHVRVDVQKLPVDTVSVDQYVALGGK